MNYPCVWKELSYNFANMDNCPLANLDSLYRAYLPLMKNTQNDLAYCKLMQRFLAHFNNGHTFVADIPPYLDPYIARFYIETRYENGKIRVKNMGKQYADLMQIGDEITHINGVEGLTIAFSQNANVRVLSKKTAGAIGQPYEISLPSALKVRINTDKTYDYQWNDVSSGFPPYYEYDFLELYKINDPQKGWGNL